MVPVCQAPISCQALTTTLHGKQHCPCLKDEQTGAQRGAVTTPRPGCPFTMHRIYSQAQRAPWWGEPRVPAHVTWVFWWEAASSVRRPN